MMKKKKHTVSRMGTIPFVGFWSLSYALGWAALVVAVLAVENLGVSLSWMPRFVGFGLFGMIPGLISSIGHQHLLRRKFGIRIPRWWLWTTITWTLAAAAMPLLETLSLTINDPMIGATFILSLLLVPASLIQALLLRQHIRQSWLWPLATIVSASIFAITVMTLEPLQPLGEAGMVFGAGLAGITQGSVVGMTLLWLFALSRRPSEQTNRIHQQQTPMKHNLEESDGWEAAADHDYFAASVPENNSILR